MSRGGDKASGQFRVFAAIGGFDTGVHVDARWTHFTDSLANILGIESACQNDRRV